MQLIQAHSWQELMNREMAQAYWPELPKFVHFHHLLHQVCLGFLVWREIDILIIFKVPYCTLGRQFCDQTGYWVVLVYRGDTDDFNGVACILGAPNLYTFIICVIRCALVFFVWRKIDILILLKVPYGTLGSHFCDQTGYWVVLVYRGDNGDFNGVPWILGAPNLYTFIICFIRCAVVSSFDKKSIY